MNLVLSVYGKCKVWAHCENPIHDASPLSIYQCPAFLHPGMHCLIRDGYEPDGHNILCLLIQPRWYSLSTVPPLSHKFDQHFGVISWPVLSLVLGRFIPRSGKDYVDRPPNVLFLDQALLIILLWSACLTSLLWSRRCFPMSFIPMSEVTVTIILCRVNLYVNCLKTH